MIANSIQKYLDELDSELDKRQQQGLLRSLHPSCGVDFASNDYLGLSHDSRLRDEMKRYIENGAIGSPASRLLRGNHPEHERVEEGFARFKRTEAALLFTSGFQANVGMLTGLIGRHDRVYSDELNHASLIDGLRLTRAQRIIFPHLDLGFLEDRLRLRYADGKTFVVVESLFSMDGDIAPLDQISELCDRYDALLLVDEAHATGVFGDTGSGLIEAFGIDDRVLATTSTCGKAFGLAGAFVSSSRVVIDYLVNHARSFIYTTAPLPILACGIGRVLEILKSEPERRTRIMRISRNIRIRLAGAGFRVSQQDSPIVSVPMQDRHQALDVSQRLHKQGYDVRALRPPTVPVGTSRLRISLHANHTEQQVDGLVKAIIDIVRV